MFYTNFVRLCNKKGVSPSAAAEEMGFQRSVVTRWSKGVTPRTATVEKVSEYFGVMPEELLADKKENAPGITAESLTDEEQELISIWRSVMSPEERTKQLAAWKARAGQQ